MQKNISNLVKIEGFEKVQTVSDSPQVFVFNNYIVFKEILPVILICVWSRFENLVWHMGLYHSFSLDNVLICC